MKKSLAASTVSTVVVSARLPRTLVARIDRLAKREQRKRSVMVHRLLATHPQMQTPAEKEKSYGT